MTVLEAIESLQTLATIGYKDKIVAIDIKGIFYKEVESISIKGAGDFIAISDKKIGGKDG